MKSLLKNYSKTLVSNWISLKMMFGTQKWCISLRNWSIFISKFGKLSHENPMIVFCSQFLIWKNHFVFLPKSKGLISRLEFFSRKNLFYFTEYDFRFQKDTFRFKNVELKSRKLSFENKMAIFSDKNDEFFLKISWNPRYHIPIKFLSWFWSV